jgi:phasin family protein
MISTTIEANSPTQEFSLCAMDSAMRTSARCFEKLAELNRQAFSAAIDEHYAVAAQAESPAEMLLLQAGLLHAAPQKAMSYWRHISNIAIDACTETMLDGERCFSESLPQTRAVIDTLTHGPAADVQRSSAVAAAKSGPRIVLAETTQAADEVASQIVDSEGNVVTSAKE